ncbi:hypothetical protein JCM12141A_12410 [Mycolicibacterium hodleri]
MVDGLNQDVPVRCQAQQRVPHQRRPRQVERPVALLGGHLVDPTTGGGVVDDAHIDEEPGHVGRGPDHRHDVAVRGGPECGAKVAMPRDEGVRGGTQPLGLDRPGQLDDLLDDVGVDVGVGGVEVNPRLQR